MAKTKIRHQTMFERPIFDYLEKKQSEYRHKNLSETVNWLLRQVKMLDDFQEKEQKEKAEKKQEPKFVGDHLLNKYKIDNPYGGD
jgi:hypothetical protein